MQNLPLVSIIVPVYNVERYLVQCVESILSQTYRNIEVILVDDGSEDTSPMICDKYAKRDKRISVIHKPNAGRVIARSDGIKAAMGEYVQFVDSDDWICFEMVEKMMDAMMEYCPDCVVCGQFKAGEKVIPEKQFFQEGYYADNRYRKNFLPKMLQTGKNFEYGIAPSLCGKLFKRKKVIDYFLRVPKSISFGEDAAVTYPYLLNACKSVYIMEECLYYYRQNPASMTKSYNKVQTENTIELLQYLREVEYKSETEDFKRQLDLYTVAVSLVNFSNEKKGGVKQLFNRYGKLKKFMCTTYLKECIKKVDLSKVDRKSKGELLIIQSGGGFGLFLLMILQYKIQQVRIRARIKKTEKNE